LYLWQLQILRLCLVWGFGGQEIRLALKKTCLLELMGLSQDRRVIQERATIGL
jgi:hypothetical protein